MRVDLLVLIKSKGNVVLDINGSIFQLENEGILGGDLRRLKCEYYLLITILND